MSTSLQLQRKSTARLVGTGSRVGFRNDKTKKGGTVASLRAAYMIPRSGGAQRRPSTAGNSPPITYAPQPIGHFSQARPNRTATAPALQFRLSLSPPKPPPVLSRYGYNRVQQYGTSSLKLPEGFSFIWALQNFREIREQTTFLSQKFIDSDTEAVWKLKVMAKQKDARDYVGVTLICVDAGETDRGKIKTSFEIAILDGEDNPFPPSLKIVEDREFSARNTWSLFQFVKLSDLDFRGNRLLCNDTLRIQCTLWRRKGEVSHLTVRPDQIPTKAKERELLSLRDTVNSFKQLLTDEKFADLDILTPTKTFKAHKLVLCARSDVFAAMLTGPMLENRQDSIQIVDFDDNAIQGMLEYLYSGEVLNLEETAGELLKIAEKYNLPGLKTLSEDSLTGNITVENACHHLALAHVYNVSKLMKSVHKFISVRSDEISKTPGFENFAKVYPDLAFEVFLKR